MTIHEKIRWARVMTHLFDRMGASATLERIAIKRLNAALRKHIDV